MSPAGASAPARAAWIALPAQVVLTGAISWVVMAVASMHLLPPRRVWPATT